MVQLDYREGEVRMVWWGMTEKRELLGLQDLLASQEKLEPTGQREALVMMDNR